LIYNNEHPNWLQIWVSVELSPAQDKLKCEMEDEISWSCSDSQHDQLGHMETQLGFFSLQEKTTKLHQFLNFFFVKTAFVSH
jgi:RAD50-interacting protein 1